MIKPLFVLSFLTLAAAGAPPCQADPSCCQAKPANQAKPATAAPAAKKTGPTGKAIPDVVLRDQNNKPVRFYTDLVQGNVVVVNFIFTTCTSVCPPLGASFSRLQTHLADRVGKNVRLITISTDPQNDTPARMRAWGTQFNAKPGWTLLTGNPKAVNAAIDAIGGDRARDHSPLVLIGNDRTGQWIREYGLASPEKLAKTIEEVTRQAAAQAPSSGSKEQP